MEFKVGDKVRILNTKFGNKGRIGIIEAISGTVMIYLVRIPAGLGEDCQWSDASDLELVEEEKVMKFKVGDKVMISNSWEGRSLLFRFLDRITEPLFCRFNEFSPTHI